MFPRQHDIELVCYMAPSYPPHPHLQLYFCVFFCWFMLSNSQLTFVASPPTFGFTWWHYFSHPPPPFVLHHHPKEFSGSDLRKNKKEIAINNQTNKQILLLFAALISQHSIIFLGIFLGYFLGIFFFEGFVVCQTIGKSYCSIF